VLSELLSIDQSGNFNDRILRLQRRTPKAWDEYIMQVPEALQCIYSDDENLGKIEREAILLLREQFYISKGGTDQQRLAVRKSSILSPQEILSLYGLIYGVWNLEPQPFGMGDPTELQTALMQSRIFKEGSEKGRMMISTTSKIEEWGLQLAADLLVGLPKAVWISEPTLRNQIGFRDLVQLDLYTSVIALKSLARR